MTLAEYYDTYWTDAGFNPPSNLTEDLERLLLQATGGRVLDVGCGNGETAGGFLTDHGRDYVGVDVSPSAVHTAQSRGLDVRLIEDAAALPFPDSSFDSAICIEVLEHLWAPHHAAAEALRVLKPGGTYFATCPNVVYWRRRADMLLFGRWHPYGDELSVEQPWRDPHIRFFTPAAMRRMVERAGFVDVRVSGHDCELFGGVPGVRAVLGRLDNPRLTRWLASHAPSLFACRINVTARKRP